MECATDKPLPLVQWAEHPITMEWPPHQMIKVGHGLWIGNKAARGFAAEHDFAVVVALQDEGLWHHLASLPPTVVEARCNILDDNEEIIPFIERSWPLVRATVLNEEKVLVHCTAGISRSAAAVIGYLMLDNGIGYDEALARLHKVHPMARPNKFFVQQLRQWKH